MAETIGAVVLGIAVLFFLCGGPELVVKLVEGRRQFKLDQLRIKHQNDNPTVIPPQLPPDHKF